MKISNNIIDLEVSNIGAEMTSLKLKDDYDEKLWQADPEFWKGRNPILFPIVGSLYDKEYMIDGQVYKFDTNHGFARNATFNLVKQEDDYLKLDLRSSEDTLRQYPFDFVLEVEYRLKNKRVEITYTISNKGEKDMPFSFGLHPAFACKVNSSKLKFSNIEDSKSIMGPFELKGDTIDLNYDLFIDNPTICFEYLKSSYVDLNDSIRIGIDGYRWFAIWTKDKADFVCLEPWHGHSDFNKTGLDFKDREGTMILKPNRQYTTSYYIELI